MVVEGSSVGIEMGGRATRSRTFSIASLKRSCTQPSDLRPPMKGDFAQMAWEADLDLGGYSTTASRTYTLLDRRRVVSASGLAKLEHRAQAPGWGGIGKLHPAAGGHVSRVVELA